jgi:Cu2+-exporting ATPase
VSETELLTLAASLEAKSEHPLAKAVLREAEARGVVPENVADFAALPGNGLTATRRGETLLGGSMAFVASQTSIPAQLRAEADNLAEQGNTPLLFTRGGKLLGVVAVADVIKDDSPQAVKELQAMGVRVVMLTGDNERTARAIGALAGVDEVISGVLPDGKEAVIRDLQKQGKVAMVGDGINDAPALTRADVGIAIGAGADVAIDAADVVLMKSRLSDVPAAVRLSRATLRNIHENLFWAFFYNAVCIPLAAGAFVRLGLTLNPMVGAAAMSLSSFCVVTNALRLNLFNMHDARHDKPRKTHTLQAEPENNKEEHTMANQITLDVEGMMCVHCEARVKKALEAVEGVVSATASHESNTAVVETNGKVDAETLKAAVEAQDYKVTAVR